MICGREHNNLKTVYIGVNPDEYDEENIYDYDNNEEEVEDKKIFGRKNNNKVVNMPQAQSQAIKMVISQPTTF